MSSEVYFDGDPATDSRRRHMERVLKGETTRKWPWLLAALGGGGLWMLFRMGGDATRERKAKADETGSTASPETLR